MIGHYILTAVISYEAVNFLQLSYRFTRDISCSPNIIQLLIPFVPFSLAWGITLAGFEILDKLKNI
jgi:hypothetical protein